MGEEGLANMIQRFMDGPSGHVEIWWTVILLLIKSLGSMIYGKKKIRHLERFQCTSNFYRQMTTFSLIQGHFRFFGPDS